MHEISDSIDERPRNLRRLILKPTPFLLLIGLFLVLLGAVAYSSTSLALDGVASDSGLVSAMPTLTETHVVKLPFIQKGWTKAPTSIYDFWASPEAVVVGETSSLSWVVSYRATKIVILPDIGDVTGQTRVVVSPTVTTNYTLLAYRQGGIDRAEAEVQVVREPVPLTFEGTPDVLELGQASVLNWTIESPVDSLTLEPGIGDVTGLASYTVWPSSTTVYTLTAENTAGTGVATETITVLGPEITGFVAAPETINVGDSSVLSWTMANTVETLTLEPGIGDVLGLDSVVVSPTETTEYTLTATSRAGRATASVTVTVRPAPAITAFEAQPAAISLGGTSVLSWTVEGEGVTLGIEPGVGDVSGQTSVVVTPTETTEYELTATNASGTAQERVTVAVFLQPAIDQFYADPATINRGQSTTLRWAVSGQVNTLSIAPGVGDVTGQTSVTVSPANTTEYILTATNASGSVEARTTVTVRVPPDITQFYANPSTILRGQSTTLRWAVSGQVTSLSISAGVGDVTGQTSKSVSPQNTTTYVLTAVGPGGQDTATTQVTVNTGGTGPELVVFDWNKPVTMQQHGFPVDRPPMPSANGNWVSPVNYADGTIYMRVQIRSQPVPQNMLLQFCWWQFDYARETCSATARVYGTPGREVTWSSSIPGMWKLNGIPLDWTQPRGENGVAIKNLAGLPVSNYNGWNWNGENPNYWYPLDMRFTVVVVAAGNSFSGWQNYP